MSLGVILATYGEPQHNTFAQQWMYSYRILRGLTRKIARIPAPLLPIIATARARGRVTLWRDHNFASPLERLHRTTINAVRRELESRGHDGATVVLPAYEFRRPGFADALLELDRAGCERAIVIPMYIAAGDFTHGMTQWAIDDTLRSVPHWRGRVELVSMTDTEPNAAELASTLAGWFFDGLRARSIELGGDWAVLLAAHGTVINPPPGVDNGLAHFQQVLGALERAIAPSAGRVQVGWLNHIRGGQWTTPAVPEALEALRAEGFSRLVYFPWGFTTDNAETMLEGRVALGAMKSSFERVEYLECMNSCPRFVSLLSNRIEQHLTPAPRTTSTARTAP